MSGENPFPGGSKIPVSALVVIHTADLEVLLIERADRPGYWQSVTGSKEPGESLSETAAREVLEETGIDVRLHGGVTDWRLTNIYPIFRRWRSRYASGVTHNTEHVFGLTLPARVPVQVAPGEHLAFRWLPWAEAAAACLSWSNQEAIRALPAHAVPPATKKGTPGRSLL